MKRMIFFVLLLSTISVRAKVETYKGEYLGVPRSTIYSIEVVQGAQRHLCDVFSNACPKFVPNAKGGRSNDYIALERWAGNTIDWTRLSIDAPTLVKVRLNDPIGDKEVVVLPSRKNVKVAKRDDHNIEFEIPGPGQYSVEIGDIAVWKHGLLIFADPVETDKPEAKTQNQIRFTAATPSAIKNLPHNITSLYFEDGVHQIGVYHIPSHVKEVYISGGAWVYGALIVKGKECSDVRIHGRGVLSGARLHLREAHLIEAIEGAENLTTEGIVVADFVQFAVRPLGSGHRTEWVKMVGGWIFNCDGICAWDNATIKNCFIWANDDNIKLYGDNILVEDCVCWQLDNGAIFQLGWGNISSHNVVVKRVDILKAAFNGRGKNHGILNLRYAGGEHYNYLFEDIVTESSVNKIINLAPEVTPKFAPSPLSNFILRNWTIKANDGTINLMIGNAPQAGISNFEFDNLRINNTHIDSQQKATESGFQFKNCDGVRWR